MKIHSNSPFCEFNQKIMNFDNVSHKVNPTFNILKNTFIQKQFSHHIIPNTGWMNPLTIYKMLC